jgi:hypothetical protein
MEHADDLINNFKKSDIGSSANVRSNITKIPNEAESSHQSAFEVRDKLKHFWICTFAE